MKNIRFFLAGAFIFARIVKIYLLVSGVKLPPVLLSQEQKPTGKCSSLTC
jgi:hypothetical protein